MVHLFASFSSFLLGPCDGIGLSNNLISGGIIAAFLHFVGDSDSVFSSIQGGIFLLTVFSFLTMSTRSLHIISSSSFFSLFLLFLYLLPIAVFLYDKSGDFISPKLSLAIKRVWSGLKHHRLL